MSDEARTHLFDVGGTDTSYYRGPDGRYSVCTTPEWQRDGNEKYDPVDRRQVAEDALIDYATGHSGWSMNPLDSGVITQGMLNAVDQIKAAGGTVSFTDIDNIVRTELGEGQQAVPAMRDSIVQEITEQRGT